MGRPSKKHMITDRVGERVDPETLPVCEEHADCFAWMEGRCTALNAKADPSACGFFKTTEQALSECRRCYRRLKEQERSDLITRYIKALTALSMLDEEIDAEEHNREQLDAFEKTNYQEQLESMIASEDAQDTDQP